MLNADQKRVFDTVRTHPLQHQRLHELGNRWCRDCRPIYMLISGVGGTGKSYLIDVI